MGTSGTFTPQEGTNRASDWRVGQFKGLGSPHCTVHSMGCQVPSVKYKLVIIYYIIIVKCVGTVQPGALPESFLSDI